MCFLAVDSTVSVSRSSCSLESAVITIVTTANIMRWSRVVRSSKKLFGFLALKLHVVGNHSGEIVVLILPSLPAGNVRFHAQQEALHLTDGFIGRNGDHIDGQHEIAVWLGQLREHAVLDIAGVVLEEKHSGIFLAQFDMIRSTKAPQRRQPVKKKTNCLRDSPKNIDSV